MRGSLFLLLLLGTRNSSANNHTAAQAGLGSTMLITVKTQTPIITVTGNNVDMKLYVSFQETATTLDAGCLLDQEIQIP